MCRGTPQLLEQDAGELFKKAWLSRPMRRGLPDETTGWLAGARDPIVGKSLALVHLRGVIEWRRPRATPGWMDAWMIHVSTEQSPNDSLANPPARGRGRV